MSAKHKPLPPERRDRKVSGWNLEKDLMSLSQRGCLGAKEKVTSSIRRAGRREEGIPRKQEQRGVRQDCLARNQVVRPEPGCSPQRRPADWQGEAWSRSGPPRAGTQPDVLRLAFRKPE